jgi:isopentenyl phosphate kinase
MSMIKKPQYTAQLIFLKLGGSLITDKAMPRTGRLDVLHRLAQEIAEARAANPALQLLLGHGSGSFGHVPARKHGTRQGVRTPSQWRGFAEVWWDAASLHRLVVEALREAGLPVVSFPPSASVTAQDGQVAAWDLAPLRLALEAGLLPVVQGDVIFDTIRGGTILSTEELFVYLAPQLHPARLLLAGIEPGVWSVYPPPSENGSGGGFRTRAYTADNTHVTDGVIPEITPENISGILPALGGSQATDVTGGMASKVRQMLALVQDLPGLEVLIFSGQKPGLVREALLGAMEGTKIRV